MFSANYYKIYINDADFDSLDQDLAALVIATSLAINEISTLNKIFVAANGPRPENDDAIKIHAAQISHIQRSLIIRLYEYLRLISETHRFLVKRKTKLNERVRKKLATSIRRVRRLRSGSNYETAELIRNKIAAHLDIKFIKQTLQQRTGSQKYEALLHGTQGNSLYLFAEDIGFMGLLGREDQGKLLPHEETIARYEGLVDWTIESSRACIEIHYDLLSLALEELPHIRTDRVWVQLEDDQIGTLATDHLPIYWKRD